LYKENGQTDRKMPLLPLFESKKIAKQQRPGEVGLCLKLQLVCLNALGESGALVALDYALAAVPFFAVNGDME
tara:strand:+ start:1221 stop:1439 length:219 start_codon:yes stop_codon:yes gene_type:complete